MSLRRKGSDSWPSSCCCSGCGPRRPLRRPLPGHPRCPRLQGRASRPAPGDGAPAPGRPADGDPAGGKPVRRAPDDECLRAVRLCRARLAHLRPGLWRRRPGHGCGDGHDDRQRDAVTGELGRGRDQRAAQPDRAPRRVHGTAGRRRHRGQHPHQGRDLEPLGRRRPAGGRHAPALVLGVGAHRGRDEGGRMGRPGAGRDGRRGAVPLSRLVLFRPDGHGDDQPGQRGDRGTGRCHPGRPGEGPGRVAGRPSALRLLAARGSRLRRLGDRPEVGAGAVQGPVPTRGRRRSRRTTRRGPGSCRTRKASAWKDVAARIQDQDPSAYQALQGRSGRFAPGSASWRSARWDSPACSASSPTCSCSPAWCCCGFWSCCSPPSRSWACSHPCPRSCAASPTWPVPRSSTSSPSRPARRCTPPSSPPCCRGRSRAG